MSERKLKRIENSDIESDKGSRSVYSNKGSNSHNINSEIKSEMEGSQSVD